VAGRLKHGAPFGYRAGKTVLHRMPAGLKLVFVIIISAFAFSSVYGLAVSVLLVLTAAAVARIPPHNLLKGSKPLVVISLCVILLKSIKPEGEGIVISVKGFFESLPAVSGLFVSFAGTALLFSVTTMRELRLSLALVENAVIRFFSRRGEKGEEKEGYIPFFSLGITLMLGFIPRFFEMWENANTACESRSCKRGFRRFYLLLPLVTERMIEASSNTALALEARGWGGNREYLDKSPFFADNNNDET
jgi:biotin transport system permease protein